MLRPEKTRVPHFLLRIHDAFAHMAHPYALSVRRIARRLSVQKSWPIISANNVEQERWRTLVKIRRITQVVLLFGFPAVIESSSPPGKILGWVTKHSYEQ